jgi:hypothetical protein
MVLADTAVSGPVIFDLEMTSQRRHGREEVRGGGKDFAECGQHTHHCRRRTRI